MAGLSNTSFRDPDGYVFESEGILYRHVSFRYRSHYDHLMQSGLYHRLVDEKLMVAHREETAIASPDAYRVLRAERIPFISYPFEWSFSQLKDAALLTLRIQEIALEHAMTLKDASSYNVQFRQGRPIFIDTLSFTKRESETPWNAYRQFCQHFLGPLAILSYCDIRFNQMMRVYLDGIPIDLAAKLLPKKTFFRFGLLLHIHLNSASQKRLAQRANKTKSIPKMKKESLVGMIHHLASTIEKLEWRPSHTAWLNYYSQTNYSDAAFANKKVLVSQFLDAINPLPRLLWDLGSNNGLFTDLATEKGITTIAIDNDPGAVEANYHRGASSHHCSLPLVMDLTNPTPSIGWANRERMSLLERGPADAVLALALVHHFAIANNTPFDKIADFLAQASEFLIIEFIPKEDSQVQKLLAGREDIFTEYDQLHFEAAFGRRFVTQKKTAIIGSLRTLYLMRRKARTTARVRHDFAFEAPLPKKESEFLQ